MNAGSKIPSPAGGAVHNPHKTHDDSPRLRPSDAKLARDQAQRPLKAFIFLWLHDLRIHCHFGSREGIYQVP